ncbi:MAG: hypothetical protein U1F22_02010 [Lysobacterales bacterium]
MPAVRLLIACLLCLVATQARAAVEATEAEPVLDSASLVQPALLSGPGYRVPAQTQVHGYMAHFDLATAYGTIHAESVEMLALREAELPALEAIDRATRSAAFAQAIAERGRKTGSALWQVVAHPLDTVTGLPAGVARYLTKKWNGWSGRAQRLSDRAARQLGNDGDPYAVPDGPLSAARAPLPDEAAPDKKNKAWYARLGSEAGREIKRQLDFAAMRRSLSRELGLDPYTSNPLINARLDDLAWAAVVGNVTAKTALAGVGGTAGSVLGDSARLNALVWELDPEDLKEANRQRLVRHCDDEFVIRQFLHRGGFTDSLRTALADELEALQPSRGCDALLELAAATRSELEARYLVNALRLVRRQAQTQGGELHVVGAAVVWRTLDGEWLLPLPVDWLAWTADLRSFFDQAAFRVAPRLALIGGEASIAAQRALTARGWGLVLKAPYEGAPAYARLQLTPDTSTGERSACTAEEAGLVPADPYVAPPRPDAPCQPLP